MEVMPVASEQQSDDSTNAYEDPQEIGDLSEHVENVVSYFDFQPDDRKTVSVVVRDADGEIVGESFPWIRSGVYALARVVDEPENPDEYGVDREDPPEWVGWIFDEPPMDHFVVGLRCRSCGETNDHILRKTPDVVSEFEWERLQHKGNCEHASEKDKETWPDRKRAREIRSRPRPRTMAVGCIWRESSELQDLLEGGRETDDAARERLHRMSVVLKDRLGTRYPNCRNCGRELRRHEHAWASCTTHCSGDERAKREFWRQYFRVWGRRGHCSHGPHDGGEVDGE